MYEGNIPKRRYNLTLNFLKTHIPLPATILDLGVTNPFSEIMQNNGYSVNNTSGVDLDDDTTDLLQKTDVVTAFEIFEHLVSPYTVLKAVTAKKLIASVPLKLWFAKAYKSKTDMWDRHYHEFEDWQFDWLLEKTGWEIKASEKWTNPVKKIGFRPLLRHFTPRYYIVYAERS